MTTLAFWHGWGISPDVFTPFITELKKDVPDNIHFKAMPLPGDDGMPLPSGNPCEIWVDAMMKNITGPVILCGWSMGAILAMSAALRYPDRIDRLILFGATPCFVEKPDWKHAVSFLTGHQCRTDVENDMHRTLRHFVSLFNHQDKNARNIVRQLLALPVSPLPVLEAGLDYLAGMDLRSQVADIHQKTLLIHGAFDPLMPVEAARWLARTLPDARLHILPDVAHAPFLSQPVQCATLVKEFLNQ